MWIFTVPPPPKKRTLNKNQEEMNPSKHPPIHTVSVFLDQAIFEPFFPWYICVFFFSTTVAARAWTLSGAPLCVPPCTDLSGPLVRIWRTQHLIQNTPKPTLRRTSYPWVYSVIHKTKTYLWFRHPLHGSSRLEPKKRPIVQTLFDIVSTSI